MKPETNIEHVDNLNSISKLEQLGFEGIDASLDVSLFEYFMAWKDLGDETLFIYSIGNNRFDRCTKKNDTDCQREFDWVNWPDFYSFLGAAAPQWDSLPLPQKIFDLVQYYGFENIFGASYWEGFSIIED